MKHPILSANIKLMMKHLNLSAGEFAEKFETTRGKIETYSQGKVAPKVDLTQKICNYFSITADQLLNQQLTENDLKTGMLVKTKSAEVLLMEARKRIELLENTVRDKERIIELMQGKRQ